MSCPYHQKAPEAVEPTSDAAAAPGRCPVAHHGSAADLAPGAEMCSHARKKLEREQQNAALAGADQPRHLPQQDWKTATGAELKSHFALAYNLVAEDVARRKKANSATIANVLMRRLGYTEADMAVIGDDAWVMQGTGNPHAAVALQPGEFVVDFGSGFGMDAFIAASRVGRTGRVVGIDLSIGEVQAAIQRASLRRLRNVDFRLGDMEDTPFEDETVDAVISNGGFCLVPDKRKAFSEIHRILKPGGRFTISCTTLLKELDPQYDWPSCFVVFMPLKSVEELLTGLGFTDVVVDTSNSRMDLWDEVKQEAKAANPEDVPAEDRKTTIHSGNPAFDFLKNLNMNEYCARVNVSAKKPQA